MSTVSRLVHAPTDAVWEVLRDAWVYPLWVVGASRARRVDGDWPAVGSELHHSVGVWPAVVDDVTEVLAVDPGKTVTLRARGWPLGEAVVVLTLDPRGERTLVTIAEDVSAGPGRLVPKPLRSPSIAFRNTETLRRLAYLAEGRAR